MAVKDYRLWLTVLLVGLSFLVLLYKRSSHYWARYRRTKELQNPPLQYIDIAASLLVAFLTTVVVLYWKSILSLFLVSASDEFRWFLVCLVGVVGIWTVKLFHPSNAASSTSLTLKQNQSAEIFDDPITRDEEDILNRVEFVNALTDQIVGLPLRAPYVFSLDGGWGEGKTSVLNLLQRRLRRNPDAILVSFNPWYVSTDASLVNSFYSALERAVLREYSCVGIRRTIHRYRDLLTPGLKFLGVDFTFSDDPIALHNEIANFINHTGRRLIIIIDDIDRLRSSQVEALFKLIGLTARFRNTIFVLCFDHSMIHKLLKDAINVDPAYLEKIIQQIVKLPAAEQKLIDRFLLMSDSLDTGKHRSAIDRLFDTLKIDDSVRNNFDEKMVGFYQPSFKKLFTNLRQAKRYLNSLRGSLPAVVHEVNLFDFCLLEAIRVNWPALYKDIWVNPWFYVPAWTMELKLADPLPGGADERSREIDEHINLILQGLHQADVARVILEELFFVQIESGFHGRGVNHSGSAATYRSEKRLTHPECFPKYFMYRSPIDDIPDSLVSKFLSDLNALDQSAAEVFVDTTFSKYKEDEKLTQFVGKIAIFSQLLNQERLQAVVRGLYRTAPLLDRRNLEVWRTEYARAERLILRLINDRAKDDDLRLLLEDVVGNSDLALAALITYSCHRAAQVSMFNIAERANLGHLRTIITERLAAYLIEGGRDIFDVMPADANFVLSEWGSDWRTCNGNSKALVESYVLKLSQKTPRRVIDILSGFVRHFAGFDSPGTFDFPHFEKVHDPKIFMELVLQMKGTVPMTEKDQKVVLLYEETYKKWLQKQSGE